MWRRGSNVVQMSEQGAGAVPPPSPPPADAGRDDNDDAASAAAAAAEDDAAEDQLEADDQINDAREALLTRQQAAQAGTSGGGGFWAGDAGLAFGGALFAPAAALSDLSCLSLAAHLDEEALVQAVLDERRAKIRAERKAERRARREALADAAEALGRLPAVADAAAAEEEEGAEEAADASSAPDPAAAARRARQRQRRDDERSYIPYLRLLGEELARYGVRVPTVRVEYRDLTATASATVGKAGVDSVSNAFLGPLRTVSARIFGLVGGPPPARKRVLRGVSGILEPGRPTLLLAPPGAGKTVLMRALAGRFPPGGTSTLRLSGSVRYNGLDVHSGAFTPARVAAFVSQLDCHVPILTVGETISFANACATVSPAAAMRARAQMRRQADREARDARRRLRRQHGDAGVAALEDAQADVEAAVPAPPQPSRPRQGWRPLLPRRPRATSADVFNLSEELIMARTRERLARVRAASRVASVTRTAGWVQDGQQQQASSAAAAPADGNDNDGDTEARLAALARAPSGITDDEDPLLRAVAPGSVAAARDNGSPAVTFSATPAPTTDDHRLAAARREFYALMQPAASSTRELRAELILRIMGLEHVRGTLVGDAMVRGVSGGQRHRVTCAEALAGPSRVLLMDEISTGLDSATLHGIVASFNASARALKSSLVCSLLQPPPEVVALYDDLLLLAGGRVLFHGPVGEAVPFFESLGFRMPPRKEPAAWLMELTTAPGQLLYATPELRAKRLLVVEEKQTQERQRRRKPSGDDDDQDSDDDDDASDPPPPPLPEALRRALASSELHPTQLPAGVAFPLLIPLAQVSRRFWGGWPSGVAMRARLREEQPHDAAAAAAHGDDDDQASTSSALPGLSFATLGRESLVRSIHRQAVLLRRDPSLLRGRITQCFWIALVIGALFWQLPVTVAAARSYFGAFFLCTLFMVTGNGPSVMAVRLSLPVWFKHRSMHLYPAWAQGAAVALVQSLPSLADALLFSCVAYWMCGFAREASRFFIFLLVMMCQSCAMGALYRLLGAAAKTLTDTQTAGSVLVLLLTLSSGYMILRPDIPGWLIWIYWLSPYAYTLRALAVNEFKSEKWALPVDPRVPMPPHAERPPTNLGEQALQAFAFQTEPFWVWVGVAYLAGLAVVLSAATAVAFAFATPPPRLPNVESARQRAARLARDRAALAPLMLLPPGGEGEGVAAPPSVLPAGKHQARPNTAGGSTDDGLPPCPPVTLVWQDLSYFVPMPAAAAAAKKKKRSLGLRSGSKKGAAATTTAPATATADDELQLLHSLTGFARPGDLVALMGGSGAGKSTLMDVLAQRKTVGRVAGTVSINGFPADARTWPRVHGYCEQMDVHSPGQLVEEALLTSARLRLPRGTSRAAVQRSVDDALQMVDLDALRGAPVGDATGAGGAGLTVEQRKRLTIAVELVARPSVVFMDEPTSGLDARAAAVVMRGVRNVALSGRAVIVTIHQPSVEIFEAFDRLYLLHRGGRCDYFGDLGPESRELVGYLHATAAASTPPLVLPPLPEGLNPATWMLSATAKGRADFWPAGYLRSELYATNAAEAARLVDEARALPGAAPLVVEGITRAGYSQPLALQIGALVRKFSQVYWRAPAYNATRLALALCLSLLYGVMFFGQGSARGRGDSGSAEIISPGTIQAIMGMLYNSFTMLGAVNMMMAMPLCASERIVFYRERGGRAYDPLAYGLAQILLEIPYLVAQAAIFCPIAYFMIGFQPSAAKFFYWSLMFLLCLALYTMIAQALVALTPSMAVAMVFQTAVQLGFNFFCGFLIAYPVIPRWLQWVNRLVPSTWLLYGSACSQLCDPDVKVQYGGAVVTAEQYMRDVFGYERALVPYMPLIVLAYILFFRLLGVLALKHVNYLKR
jgi:ABC-type multidrug transport system ATPase subunit/ABC-type multidrug transport system permease subunit